MKHIQTLGRSIGLTIQELFAKLPPSTVAPGMVAARPIVPTSPKPPLMSAAHFSEQRLAEIYGGSPLTVDERAFLIADTPNFGECHVSEAGLAGMSDIDLIREARRAWLVCKAHT